MWLRLVEDKNIGVFFLHISLVIFLETCLAIRASDMKQVVNKCLCFPFSQTNIHNYRNHLLYGVSHYIYVNILYCGVPQSLNAGKFASKGGGFTQYSGQDHGLWNKKAWIQIPALSLTSIMSVGKKLCLHSYHKIQMTKCSVL